MLRSIVVEVTALIAGIFGLLTVLIQSFNTWAGPRHDRELMRLDLDLRDRMLEGSGERRDLSKVIAQRASRWEERDRPNLVTIRKTQVAFVLGGVALALNRVPLLVSRAAWWQSVAPYLRYGLIAGAFCFWGYGMLVLGALGLVAILGRRAKKKP